MTRAALVALAATLVAACGQDAVSVTERGGADHNRAALLAAARQFRVAGNTPRAYAELTRSVLTLRVGMDETVAEEAELLLVTLALDALADVPGAATGAEPPILTVWPIGLAPRLSAPVPGRPLADAWSEYMPGPEEDAGQYAMRLCGAQLARGCGHVVPEGQAAVVAALAIGRFTARARAAVSNCLTCSDPGWAKAVKAWEALDSAAVAYVEPARQRMAASRWPVAGPGAGAAAAGPTLEIEDDGTTIVNGEPVGPSALAPLLAAARRESKSSVLRVHVAPTAPAERLRVAVGQAAGAGYAHVALLARVPRYPWALVAYEIDAGAALPVRDTDPVQVLARVYDSRATQ